jgi:hypothetical protein
MLEARYILSDNFKVWPKKTSIWCYNCCHPFKTQPLGLPVEYRKTVFHVEGVFCSFECMKRFNSDQTSSIKYQRANLITLLRQKMYPNQPDCIKMALPKYLLKVFGGNLSIEQFRTNFQPIEMLSFPLIPINPGCENSANFTWSNKEEALQNLSDFSSNNSEETILKMKRNTTRKTNQSTLESSMGITTDKS